MFCRYCGAKTSEDSVFCPACGQQLVGAGTRQRPSAGEKRGFKQFTDGYKQTAAAGRRRGPAVTGGTMSRKKLVLILFGLAALVLVSVLGSNYISRQRRASRISDPNSPNGIRTAESWADWELGMNPPGTVFEDAGTPAGAGNTDSSAPAAGGSGAQTAAAKSCSASDAVLPDPGPFLNCARGEDKSYTWHGSDGWLVSCSFELDQGETAAADFLTLLEEPRYQLELGGQREKDWRPSSARLCRTYYYSYTGTNSNVREVKDVDDYSGDVIVSVYRFYDEGRILLSLYFSSAFTLEDSGEQASVFPADYNGVSASGGASGGDGVYIPEFAKQDCPICHGSGNCQTCGGDGYLYSLASKEENRNCTDCRNHDGKCTYCNGTGKR